MKTHRNYNSDEKNNNEIKIEGKEYKDDWKDRLYVDSFLYDDKLAHLFLKIKFYKMRYFLFKPITRFLHFDLISSILLNKRESGLAIFALLCELATVAVETLYFSLQISLFVFIGFGVLYTLIYAIRRIYIYISWCLRENSLDTYGAVDEDDVSDVSESDKIYTNDHLLRLQEEENRSSYASRFIKKNYIAVIAFLFESAAITFTALYFSLQIGLFVFLGFSLLYVLICVARKIINYRAEPKISTDTELDDDNASASVNSKAEEKIPLSENNLQKGKN